MGINFKAFVFIVCVVALLTQIHGGQTKFSRAQKLWTLNELREKSDEIVVARLLESRPSSEAVPAALQGYAVNAEILSFKVLFRIKGECPDIFKLLNFKLDTKIPVFDGPDSFEVDGPFATPPAGRQKNVGRACYMIFLSKSGNAAYVPATGYFDAKLSFISVPLPGDESP